MRTIAIALAALAACAPAVDHGSGQGTTAQAATPAGRTIHVPADQPTIAAALAAAAAGDTVRLAPGTYAEAIALKDGVRIVGGPSTIDASGLFHGVTGDGTVRSARLSGLTIQGAQGRGVFLVGSGGVRITDSTIRGSGLQGVLARGAQVRLERVELSGNGSQGLFASDSDVAVEASRVLDNVAAGLRFDGGQASVERCLIRNNGGTGAVRFLGAVRGRMKGTQVVDNRNMGVEVDPYASTGEGRPSVALEGNAITGSRQHGLYVMAGDLRSHGDRIDGNGFWSATTTFDGVAATAGATLRLEEGSVSGNAVRGVYASDVDFTCADADCTLWAAVQGRTRVEVRKEAVGGNGFSGLFAEGGGEFAVRESTLSGNGTAAVRHGVWLRSGFAYDLGDGVLHTVDIPGSVAVRETRIEGNSGYALRLEGTSTADLGSGEGGENALGGNARGGVLNLTAGTVPAAGNWWGTADAAAIAAMNVGDVQFLPFLTSAP